MFRLFLVFVLFDNFRNVYLVLKDDFSFIDLDDWNDDDLGK